MPDDKPVTLEFLGRQQKQMLDEFADFRDQLTVQTAICMRVEGAIAALTTEICAMHSRHARLERRVETLEKAQEP